MEEESNKNTSFLAIINTLIHMMIAIVLFNIWSYALTVKFEDSKLQLHILFHVTGYLLLMMEAIMTFNGHNSWSRFLSKKNKKMIHLLLNAAGAVCVLIGFILITTYKKSQHFNTAHGICGLISFIFTLISVLNGTITYFAPRLNNVRITPVKLGHTIIGSITISMGLITLCLGINKSIFYDKNIAICLTVMIAITLVYTLIQPILNARVYAHNMRTTVL